MKIINGIKIKNCSKCNVTPMQQSDELGFMYRLICGKCGNHTHDVISKSATLQNPYMDSEAFSTLANEWNSIN